LSGEGLCEDLITRPEESYRMRCIVVCDLETSKMRISWPNAPKTNYCFQWRKYLLGDKCAENKLLLPVTKVSTWTLH